MTIASDSHACQRELRLLFRRARNGMDRDPVTVWVLLLSWGVHLFQPAKRANTDGWCLTLCSRFKQKQTFYTNPPNLWRISIYLADIYTQQKHPWYASMLTAICDMYTYPATRVYTTVFAMCLCYKAVTTMPTLLLGLYHKLQYDQSQAALLWDSAL